MKNRMPAISLLATGIVCFAIPSSVRAENDAPAQGIEAPSAYLESIENPGASGGVEEAAAAAEQGAEHEKAKDPKQD